jgi:hypothetical protein
LSDVIQVSKNSRRAESGGGETFPVACQPVIKDVLAAERQVLKQSIRRRREVQMAANFRKSMIWKNKVAVNPENSSNNNLIDCSSPLKYHPEIPLNPPLKKGEI